jgi:O-antigen/teichoic acid export membrane protein
LKKILVFGSKSFVQGISGRVENGTDSLIIGYFLGPAMVPFYSIPANLVHYIRTLGWTLTHAFMPLFSGMSARSEDGNMRDVYLIASKYVLAIILALAVGVSIVGGPFLILWLGPEFREKSDIVIILLVIFTAGPFINPFASRYLTAIGKHGIFAYLSPLSALINIGLSLALVHRYGIVGVAFASTITVFIFNPIYLWYACKHLMLPVRHYLKVCFLPSLVPAVVLGAIVLQFRLHGGLEAYPMLITSVLVSGFAWFVAFWFLALRSGEREFIVARIRGRQSGSYPCPSAQIEDRPNPRSID